MKSVYQNRLPHLAPFGATFFVTFRLADSLPKDVVSLLKHEFQQQENKLKKDFPVDWKERARVERKRMFGKYEHFLESSPLGECVLKKPAIAKIVADKLHEFDGEYYDLEAYCIMSNHVHMLLDFSRQIKNEDGFFLLEAPETYKQLDYVMMRIKGGTSFLINRALAKSGTLWAKDSYDHYVRDEAEYHRILDYILQNPVKAGIVKTWDEFPHTYKRI